MECKGSSLAYYIDNIIVYYFRAKHLADNFYELCTFPLIEPFRKDTVTTAAGGRRESDFPSHHTRISLQHENHVGTADG